MLQRQLMEEFSLEFSVMNDGEKLKTLATKTLDLYRKAKQFDDQMISLNR